MSILSRFRARKSARAFDRHAGRRFADIYEGDQGYNAGRYRAGGAPFIVLKATEGNSFIDRDHAPRCESSHMNGLAVGHYHFYHENGTPEFQARHFWGVVHGHFLREWPRGRGHDEKPHSHLDFLILDIEAGGGTPRADEVANFCREILRLARNDLGFEPTLIGYSNKAFLMEHNLHVPGDKWWVAEYPDFPGNIGHGRTLWAHQFTDHGTIPGVGQPCDCSVISNRESIRYWEKQ